MEGVLLRISIVLIAALIASVLSCQSQDNSSAEAQAVESAEAWLELVDQGAYGASWSEAAEYFRFAITQENWERSAAAVRDPLGDVTSRELGSATFATTLPGAPDGEYVVLLYNTVFVNKKIAVETVTPMLDTDGEWRVSGYHVK